jgi:tetratricopeptide (TPR) repeat protein
MISASKLGGQIPSYFFHKLLILVAGFWVFLPAFHGEWLWDDGILITQNPLMNDPAGLWKIWFQPGIIPDYYPLTTTVEWMQWKLWGLNTLGYHLTNFILHMTSAFLVWHLLSKLGLRLAWLGGLIFAIHPVQVESVAWAAELKNTLSMPPMLLAMCAWIDYDSSGKRRDYFVAFGLFLFALLCKLTVVMFPVIILLYAWWRRGRIAMVDVAASLPFFALSLAVGSIPILSGMWTRTFSHLGPEFLPPGGLAGRVVLAGLAAAFYFSKCVLPVGLLPVYPKWTVDVSSPTQYLPWVCLAGAVAWFWTRRQTWGRHALFGLGFFLINLLPCPGFIPGPNMAYAWVMDHFLYLPIIGLIGLAVAAIESLLAESAAPPLRIGITAAVAVAMLCMTMGGHAYAKLFADPMLLWNYAAERNPASWMVHLNLGETFLARGHAAQAVEEFGTALKLEPVFPDIRYDLADALHRNGQFADAAAQYKILASIHPHFHDVDYRLGVALAGAHRFPEAIDQFQALLQSEPGNAAAHKALGDVLEQAGKTSEADEQYAKASALDSTSGNSHYDRGTELLRANRLPEALAEFQKAAQISPKNVDVLDNLGVALARSGRLPEAAQQFEAALQIDPNSAPAHTNMGSLFLVAGKLPEAIEQYREALRLKPDFVEAQQDLARAQTMAAQAAPTAH